MCLTLILSRGVESTELEEEDIELSLADRHRIGEWFSLIHKLPGGDPSFLKGNCMILKFWR